MGHHFRTPGIGPRLPANSDTELTPDSFSLTCFGFFSSRFPFRFAIVLSFGQSAAVACSAIYASSISAGKQPARGALVSGNVQKTLARFLPLAGNRTRLTACDEAGPERCADQTHVGSYPLGVVVANCFFEHATWWVPAGLSFA